MHFENKVALVTGAGSGIGEATARLLASRGARVGVLSRTFEEVQRVAESIQSDGGEALALGADISKMDEMESAVQKLVDQWGRVDIVAANAGINGTWAPLDELTLEDWDKTLSINVIGTFITLKTCLPYLKKRGGSVIITASVNGTRIFSNTGATIYSCSKAAQVAFAKMTALELAKHGIRVNVICPGAIETQIDDNTQREHLEHIREPVEFPEGRIPLTDGKPGKARQVAQLIEFLASDASSHITGSEMWIDGAESLLQG